MTIGASIKARAATVKSVIRTLASEKENEIFLVDPTTSETVSFAQLDQYAQRLEEQLRARQLKRRSKIAVLMDNSIETAQLFLSLMYCGYVVVPLNCADSPKGWQRVLVDSESAAIIVGQNYLKGYGQIESQLSSVVLIGKTGSDPAQNEIETDHLKSPEDSEEKHLTPESDALIAYTSGSTGNPKGALFSHHNLLFGGLNTVDAHELTQDDVSLLVLPLYHMNAQIVTLMSTLISGGKVVVPLNFNVQNFWEQVQTHRCTWFALVPTIVSQLVQRAEVSGFQHTNVLEHVRFARSSSAPLNPNLHEQFEKIFSMPMLEAMGMTEAGGAIFSNPLPPAVRKIGSPGLPFGFQASLKDAQPSDESGMVGELLLKGESNMKGYFNQPELTKQMLSDDGVLTTGDIARIDEDGFVFIVGRTSEVIRKGAEKIPPREIENVLLRHPAVAEAAVIGVPEPHWGNEIVAFVTVKPDKTYDENQLLEHCRAEVGLLKTPRAIIVMEDFPRAAAFKINKKALIEFAPSFTNLSLSKANTDGETNHQSITELERQILAIWSDVLQQNDIAVEDDFFSLGGTSLLATAIAVQVKAEFKIDIGLAGFLEYSTIRQQANAIANSTRGSYKGGRARDISTVEHSIESGDGAVAINPASLHPTQTRYPLSSAQERIWLFEQITPGTATYNESEAVRLHGPLDLHRFEQALSKVISKHQILRARFRNIDGSPVQEMMDYTITPEIIDISENIDSLDEEIERFIRRPFEFECEPLLRMILLKLAQDEHVFLFVMHHLICDRASIGIFMREVSDAYNSQFDQSPVVHTKLAMQFGEFAAAQKDHLQTQESRNARDFWLSRLASVEPVLDIPTTFAHTAEPTFNGAKVTRRLSELLADDISAASKRHRVTTFEFMASALALVVQKYTSQRDFAIAMPIDKRMSADLLPMIGFFADTHFVSFHLQNGKTVAELLRETHDEFALTRKFSNLPLEQALQNQPRAVRNREFIPILINQRYARDRSDALQLADIKSELITTHNGCAKFPITVTITYGANEFSTDVEYNTDLFDNSSIERLLNQFECSLKHLCKADSDREELDSISILPDAEYKFVTQEINSLANEYPKLPVHALFRKQAAMSPNEIAVECRGTKLTYKELDEKTDYLAELLQQRKSEDNSSDFLVGMYLERSEDIVISMLAILKAGGAYVPLDPQYPKERLKFMIEDAGIKTVLTHAALSLHLSNLNLDMLAVDAIFKTSASLEKLGRSESERSDSKSRTKTAQNKNASDQITSLAYVTYTSGSTGKPKGVEIPHQGILRLIFGNNYASLDKTERILHHSAVTFDLTTFEVWAPLLHGGCCVVHAERSTDIATLAQSIHDEKITTMWLTASLYNELIVQLPQSLQNLRQLIVGGEALSVHHTVLGLKQLPQTKFVNGYGPTENTTLTTCYQIPKDFSDSANSVPIGKPINHTTVFVLDETLKPVPIGVQGELFTGGDGLARGYRNRADLTNERFICNPFEENGKRLYATGDKARILSDGNVEYLGRLDDQVKLRGFRIEPGEIDRVLIQHSRVHNCVTVVREDTPTGRALVSYFSSDEDIDLTQSLREHLKNFLPSYMVPSYFVRLTSLPVNPSGKTDRTQLPRPTADIFAASILDVPLTTTEEIVTGLMAEVLGRQSISTTDDFFDVGGHSLLALQFIDNVSAAFDLKVPVAALFDSPTPRAIAKHIDSKLNARTVNDAFATRENTHSLLAIKPGGSRRPIFFTPGGDGTESAFLVYAKLARQLKDVPFYGLRARGVAYGIEPHLTVEAMARDYLMEVRRLQPHGPYTFAGECVGGVIAYEMARQAKEQGDEIELLLLLDCRPPTAAQFASKRIKWAWSRLSGIASKTLSKEREHDAATVANSTIGESAVPQTSTALTLKDLMWVSYQKTLLRYRPKEYKGDIVLLLNEDYAKLNLAESWQKFVQGKVRTVLVNGDHITYIREHATQTASEINKLLGSSVNC